MTRGFRDPFPRLPPGVTPSDIDREMLGPKCPECGNHEVDGHADGCRLADKPYCTICNPRPDEHKHHGPTGTGPVFCSEHNQQDLRERMREPPDDHDRA